MGYSQLAQFVHSCLCITQIGIVMMIVWLYIREDVHGSTCNRVGCRELRIHRASSVPIRFIGCGATPSSTPMLHLPVLRLAQPWGYQLGVNPPVFR